MLPARWVVLAALCLPLVAVAQSPAAAPVPAAPALVAPDVPAGEDAARDAELSKIAAGFVDAFSNSGGRLTRDGKGIVFVSSRTGLPQPFVSRVGEPGEAARRLVEWPQRVVVDVTTPDGRSVIFRSDKGADENWSIYRVPLEGGAPVWCYPGETMQRDTAFVAERLPGTVFFSLRPQDERGFLGPLLGPPRGWRRPNHLPRPQAVRARRRDPRREGRRGHPLPDRVGHAAPPRRGGKRQGATGLPAPRGGR